MFRYRILHLVHITVIVAFGFMLGSVAGHDEVTAIVVAVFSSLIGIGAYVAGLSASKQAKG